MSISVLNRGGISGGLTAVIAVKGLSEADSVTAGKDGVIKNGVWNASENRHEISGIKDLGTWTVTATDGTKTKTQDVLLEVIGLYEIEMDYRLWLYREGDECEEITGGWNAYPYRVGGYNNAITPSIEKGNDYIYGSISTTTSDDRGVIMTNNRVNLTPFRELKIHIVEATGYTPHPGVVGEASSKICVSKTKGDGYISDASSAILTFNNSPVTDSIVTVNIEDVTSEEYVIIGFLNYSYNSSRSYSNVKFDKVWLE